MNLLSIFSRKTNDFVVVAKLSCGFKFIRKAHDSGDHPLLWEAWLYENSEGKRKFVEHGSVRIPRSTRNTLTKWKKHKMVISIIPSYHGIITGQQPYELDTTP